MITVLMTIISEKNSIHSMTILMTTHIIIINIEQIVQITEMNRNNTI